MSLRLGAWRKAKGSTDSISLQAVLGEYDTEVHALKLGEFWSEDGPQIDVCLVAICVASLLHSDSSVVLNSCIFAKMSGQLCFLYSPRSGY